MVKTRFSLLSGSIVFVLSLTSLALTGCAPLHGVKSDFSQSSGTGGGEKPTADQPPAPVLPPSTPAQGQVGEITYGTILTTVLSSELPVLLEEYDPSSCDSACLEQHKLVDELAVAYAGRVRFYRITTSEAEFSTGVIYPVYYLVRPGSLRVLDAESGIKSKEELTKFLDEALAALAKAP
ncbi:MAG: hypothetical protein K2Y32_22080 [Candidatus Obscuribacterales bacterium]|nr:hypothetical protein [Candidatus Obscuribacterales bacterium]